MTVLHLGCGQSPLPKWFGYTDEVRLDANPAVRPDVVASITDVGPIGPFDAVYSSHVLEHVYPHEVPIALQESRRVLKDGGFAVHIVPNLTDVKPTDEVVYESEAGPVTGHDMHYGMASLIADNPYMAHKCGFTLETLRQAMEGAGFSKIEVRVLSNWNLVGIGVK